MVVSEAKDAAKRTMRIYIIAGAFMTLYARFQVLTTAVNRVP